jgi:hypothetical protein
MSEDLVEIDAIEVNLEEKENILKVNVPKEYLKYNLSPQLVSTNKILYYNAKDLSFYQRKPKNSLHKIWLYTHSGI